MNKARFLICFFDIFKCSCTSLLSVDFSFNDFLILYQFGVNDLIYFVFVQNLYVFLVFFANFFKCEIFFLSYIFSIFNILKILYFVIFLRLLAYSSVFSDYTTRVICEIFFICLLTKFFTCHNVFGRIVKLIY